MNDLQEQKRLAKYQANLKAFKDETYQAHIDRVNHLRQLSHERLKTIRMHRLIVMDEAGQPIADIHPEEEKKIQEIDSLVKRKEILDQTGVMRYLQPFYENTWNHKITMSAKRVKDYVGVR